MSENRPNQLTARAEETSRNPEGTLGLRRQPSDKVNDKWAEVLADDRYEELLDSISNRKQEKDAAHEARMTTIEADRAEALRRLEKVSKSDTVDDNVPIEVKEHPRIKKAVEELTPILGEDRAKAVVYGGIQQGWQPGPPGGRDDPYAEIGKSLIAPMAKAMGENFARTLKPMGNGAKTESGMDGDQDGKSFDITEVFKRRKVELEAEEEYLDALRKRRQEFAGLEQNPKLEQGERSSVGFEIKTIDDAIRWQGFQTKHDIDMFNMNEESRRRWATYLDDKEMAGKRNHQVDEVINLAKDHLGDAIAAGKAAAQSFRGKDGEQGSPPSKKGRDKIAADAAEASVECAWCGEGNLVQIGTKSYNCGSCGKPNEIGPVKE